jgi:hypothetical protein
LPRTRVISGIVLICATALAVAGCKNSAQVFTDQNDGGWFSKPVEIFNKPEWAKPASVSKTADLGPSGPVGPDDLVGGDGRCGVTAPPAQAAAPEQPPADRAVGSVAGDLAGTPMPAGAVNAPDASGPTVMGGVALGMTECQTVQRAGTPGNVSIGSGEKGDRSVVLTYLSGPWPGIYRFSDGRLKVVERAPAPPAPPKAPPKKKKAAKKPAAPQ